MGEVAARLFASLPDEVKPGVKAALDFLYANPILVLTMRTTIYAAGRYTYTHPQQVDRNGTIYITFRYGKGFPTPDVIAIYVDYTADEQGPH